MTRFVLDANLSPRTASFLSVTFGFDVVALLAMGLGHLDDDQVVAMAKREQRVVITFDLGFGRLYHRYEQGQVGVFVLRPSHQSAESVNRALHRFFADPVSATIALERSLVVIDETRVRVITSS